MRFKMAIRYFIFSLSLLAGGFLMPNPSLAADTVYDFSFEKLNSGDPLPLKAYEGKVILVVNTASKCGFTGQYEGLEKLHNTYKDQGLVVLGVPSADFAGQEFGDDGEIKKFCELNFGVTFPLASKEHVKGKDAHPFYKAAADRFGFMGSPKWNFHKYLINRKGEFVTYYMSTTKPLSGKLKKAIEKELKK